MKKIFLLFLLCVLSSSSFAQKLSEDIIKPKNKSLYEAYQDDVDIVRMQHFDYYAKLLNEYYQKTNHYPFQDIARQEGMPIYVFILNDTQKKHFKDDIPYEHAEAEAKDFFLDLETELGKKIEEKYDPQNYRGPDGRPTMYMYMVTKDQAFFAVHLYSSNRFTKKIATHYYKIEFANEDDKTHQLYTYKTLQKNPEYQRIISQKPQKQEYFDARAKGEI